MVKHTISEGRRNYLVIHAESRTESFELEMLRKNEIADIIRPELRRLDGRDELYYEISGYKSVEMMYGRKSIGFGAVYELFEEIYSAGTRLEEYFLDELQLGVEPELILINSSQDRFLFPYVPFVDTSGSMRKLADFLLEHIDYKDNQIVDLIFEFNQILLEERDDFHHWWTEKRKNYVRFPHAGNKTGEKESGNEGQCTGGDIEDSGDDEKEAEEENEEYERRRTRRSTVSEASAERFVKKSEEKITRSRGHSLKDVSLLKIIKWTLIGASAVFLLILLTLLGLFYEMLYLLPAGIILMAIVVWLVLNYLRKFAPEEESLFGKTQIEQGMTEIPDFGEIEEEADPIGLEKSTSNPTICMDLRKNEERKLYAIEYADNRKIQLSKLPCEVGSDETYADEVLTDKSVSRLHARFFEQEGSVWVRDMNSTNGTYINGIRLSPGEQTALNVEDEIRFGRALFVYR